MVLQLFVVSRVVRYLGVPVALRILPLVAFGSYFVAALIPSLAIVRWVKTAERSVDYSLQNTVAQMLYLPTTREEKYKAKQVTDTFAVRAGDVLAAATVFVGSSVLALSVSQFALINVLPRGRLLRGRGPARTGVRAAHDGDAGEHRFHDHSAFAARPRLPCAGLARFLLPLSRAPRSRRMRRRPNSAPGGSPK